MTEHHLSSDTSDLEEPGFLRLLRHLHAQSQAAGGPAHERRVTGGIGRREDTRRGIEDLRELAAGLHPAILTQHGLSPAIRSLADRAGIAAEIDVPGVRLPPSIEASLYFFCSEVLTNIVKHAHATRAWVRLEAAAGRCVIEIRDDGIGGAGPRPETSGLIGLSDRIGAIGGTLDITSPPSGGTVLRATVPLPHDAA